MNTLTRGDVAKQTGVNIETLRYYEKRGLVSKPARNSANYRVYGEDTVRRIRFVKRAQELGFSLKEIKALLSLRAKPETRCESVRKRSEAKITDIDNKIRTLNAMRSALSKLVSECSGRGEITECPILTALDSESWHD